MGARFVPFDYLGKDFVKGERSGSHGADSIVGAVVVVVVVVVVVDAAVAVVVAAVVAVAVVGIVKDGTGVG